MDECKKRSAVGMDDFTVEKALEFLKKSLKGGFLRRRGWYVIYVNDCGSCTPEEHYYGGHGAELDKAPKLYPKKNPVGCFFSYKWLHDNGVI